MARVSQDDPSVNILSLDRDSCASSDLEMRAAVDVLRDYCDIVTGPGTQSTGPHRQNSFRAPGLMTNNDSPANKIGAERNIVVKVELSMTQNRDSGFF